MSVRLIVIVVATLISYRFAVALDPAPSNPPPANGAPANSAPVDPSKINGAEVIKTGNVVTGLNFKDCSTLTDADYQQIRQLTGLKTLAFAHGPNDASLKIIAGMPAIESITTNGMNVSDAGLALFATFKNLHTLTMFHPGKDFPGTGFVALASLPDLESMTVGGSLAFANPGMAAVAQLSHLKAFRTWHTGVTLEGVKSLTALKNLKSLTLGQRLAQKGPPTLNDDAVAVLAGIPSLEELNLMEARLSLSSLSKLQQLPNLKHLKLDGIEISESDIATLKQQLPKVQIIWNPPNEADKKRIDGIFGTPPGDGASGLTAAPNLSPH